MRWMHASDPLRQPRNAVARQQGNSSLEVTLILRANRLGLEQQGRLRNDIRDPGGPNLDQFRIGKGDRAIPPTDPPIPLVRFTKHIKVVSPARRIPHPGLVQLRMIPSIRIIPHHPPPDHIPFELPERRRNLPEPPRLPPPTTLVRADRPATHRKLANHPPTPTSSSGTLTGHLPRFHLPKCATRRLVDGGRSFGASSARRTQSNRSTPASAAPCALAGTSPTNRPR